MMKIASLFSVLAIATCQDDTEIRTPIEITEESAGYYCQMSLVGHVGPKGQIYLDGLEEPLFFSQVRDLISYLHMPEQDYAVEAAYVQDMKGASWEEPGSWIKAKDAYYVTGSDAKGGMEAPEFVPFSDRESAIIFMIEHGGTVSAFDEITTEQALAPASSSLESEDRDVSDMTQRLQRLSEGERD